MAEVENAFETINVDDRPLPDTLETANGPRLNVERTCMFIGKTGSGKSSCFKCLSNRGEDPVLSLFAGTRGTPGYSLQFQDLGIKAFDTEGFTGVYEQDKKLFNEAIKTIKRKSTYLSRIFLCFAAGRFTRVDEEILKMIKNETTTAFKLKIIVIVTHCPASMADTIKGEVAQVIDFIPDVRNKCICIDLKDFTTDANLQLELTKTYWTSVRNQLKRCLHDADDPELLMTDVFESDFRYIWYSLFRSRTVL